MPVNHSRSQRLRSRPGMTMVEVMVVVVLLAIVGGTVMSVLAKQQAFYRSTADVLDLRSQLRQAAAILTTDLRGVASGSNDIVSMSESSVEFYYTVGSSAVCQVQGGTMATLPPRILTRGNVITDWVNRPARGDLVYMYADPDTSIITDDTWLQFAVDTVVAGNALCTNTSPLVVPQDDASDSYRLVVSSGGSSIPSSVRAGSAVRFMRKVVYQLYQSSGDGRWYLGYCAGTCSSVASLQPLAGPLSPLASGTGTSGLRFAYYDANGNVTSDRTAVARISFVLRGQTRAQINVPGMGKGYYTDSLRTDVALRNRT